MHQRRQEEWENGGKVDSFYKGIILIRHIKIEITYYYMMDKVDGDLFSRFEGLYMFPGIP